jgi:hypothetical protein
MFDISGGQAAGNVDQGVRRQSRTKADFEGRAEAVIFARESGQAVEKFQILIAEMGYNFGPSKEGTSGTFSIRLGSESKPVVIEIHADGYSAERIENISNTGGDKRLEFRLRASTGWNGQVLLPSGEPAAGAGARNGLVGGDLHALDAEGGIDADLGRDLVLRAGQFLGLNSRRQSPQSGADHSGSQRMGHVQRVGDLRLRFEKTGPGAPGRSK